jgi:TfoX/Sxy family transcriptional regulator of competence genes
VVGDRTEVVHVRLLRDVEGRPQQLVGASDRNGTGSWHRVLSKVLGTVYPLLGSHEPYDPGMAYDEQLAVRIRELLAGEAGLTEKRMFGGLAFLVGGNMAVGASGQGGILVRVDPAQSDRLVASTTARPMEMRGRQMQGWLRLTSDDVRTKRQLAKWVALGAAYARSLPPKR